MLFMPKTIFTSTLLAFFLCAAQMAQAVECRTSNQELALSLPGTWSVKNGFGTLSFQGRTMPIPPGNSDTAEIIPTADGLAVTGGFISGTYALEFVTDARFVLDAPSKAILEQGETWFDQKPEVLTSAEIELLAGCAKGQLLPQLKATGTFKDPEGFVDFELFLFVLNERNMYGIIAGDLRTMGGKAKRVTRWSR